VSEPTRHHELSPGPCSDDSLTLRERHFEIATVVEDQQRGRKGPSPVDDLQLRPAQVVALEESSFHQLALGLRESQEAAEAGRQLLGVGGGSEKHRSVHMQTVAKRDRDRRSAERVGNDSVDRADLLCDLRDRDRELRQRDAPAGGVAVPRRVEGQDPKTRMRQRFDVMRQPAGMPSPAMNQKDRSPLSPGPRRDPPERSLQLSPSPSGEHRLFSRGGRTVKGSPEEPLGPARRERGREPGEERAALPGSLEPELGRLALADSSDPRTPMHSTHAVGPC